MFLIPELKGRFMQFSFDTKLNKIAAKVEASERLTFDEGVALYKTDELGVLL